MKCNLSLVAFLLASCALAVPANKVWRVSPGETVPSWGPLNLSDGTNAVTNAIAKARVGTNTVISSSSGGFNVNTATLTDVTNLSVTITTSGKPVLLQLIGATTSGSTPTQIIVEAGSGRACFFNFLRGSTTIASNLLAAPSAGGHQCGELIYLDPVGAGTYTYKVQTAHQNGTFGRQCSVNRCRLMATELW